MTDLDKLNAIITKARLMRDSVGITPREFMLSDLVESLAHQLLALEREMRQALAFRELPAEPTSLTPRYRPGATA